MEETAAGRGQGRQRAARPRSSRGRGTAARRGSTAREASADEHPADEASRAGVPRRTAQGGEPPLLRTLSARSRAAGGPRLREVLSQLSLGRQDVSEASGLVNHVVSHLIQAVRGRDGSFSSIGRLGAGSYYEHVKVRAGLAQIGAEVGELRLGSLEKWSYKGKNGTEADSTRENGLIKSYLSRG